MRRVRRQFPGAHVQASTFDAFLLPLARAVRGGLELPVVTQEASPGSLSDAHGDPESPLCASHTVFWELDRQKIMDAQINRRGCYPQAH